MQLLYSISNYVKRNAAFWLGAAIMKIENNTIWSIQGRYPSIWKSLLRAYRFFYQLMIINGYTDGVSYRIFLTEVKKLSKLENLLTVCQNLN